MTTLHPDLEALMPEPAFELTWRDDLDRYFVSKPNIGDAECYTATQMREAILAATERAAKVCDEMADRLSMQWRQEHKTSAHLEGQSDGAFDCATAIRGAAASTGRGEGGGGA